MASRYRASIERVVQPKKTHPKSASLINYESSPEPVNVNCNLEALQARLRHKAQIENKLRDKLRSLTSSVEMWRGNFNGKVDQCDYLKDELALTRKRHAREMDELRRELRWNQKKVKTLELTITENNAARLSKTLELLESNKRLREANDILTQENSRLSELQEEHAPRHEQIITELEQLKQIRNEDLINIQNLENAVKALHDENIILKETPMPVVLPPCSPGQQKLGQQLYQFPSQRPIRPCVSLLDQRAQEIRRKLDRRPGQSRALASPSREHWPYSSSSEDISWGH